MTAVEAQASGKPVIALGRGGALESVPTADPMGGVFYDVPETASLLAAMRRFESCEALFEPFEIQAHARKFSTARFDAGMRAILEDGTRSGLREVLR